MALPTFVLERNIETSMWHLKDEAGNIVINFNNKEDALRRGVLREAIGPEGGVVRIMKHSGALQEERTFPRSKDASKFIG